MHTQPATDSSSLSQTTLPGRMSSTVSFEAMGISNPPCWSVSLADNTGSTKVVQVSRAPTAEGLPLPSDLPVRKSFACFPRSNFVIGRLKNHGVIIQEPHKAALEYLFELVAALKHMLSTRVSCSLRSLTFVSFKMLILFNYFCNAGVIRERSR